MKSLGYQFFACGRRGFPVDITLCGQKYVLQIIFKHDFFAGTSLYRLNDLNVSKNVPEKVILKINRRGHFLFIPLRWLGRLICNHEIAMLERLKHLDFVPHLIARFKDTGFIYKYIEGIPLDSASEIPEDFFDNTYKLLMLIHNENIVYVDMNKRSNIIISPDGRPYLIDFQISQFIKGKFFVTSAIRDFFRRADIYHLFKHKRRLCPHLLTPEEKTLSYCKSPFIRLHRMIATPFRTLRRAFLNYLKSREILTDELSKNCSNSSDF